MFTGIVQTTGRVEAIHTTDAGARLMAEPNKDEHWLGFERFVPEQVGFSSCFYTACSIGSAPRLSK